MSHSPTVVDSRERLSPDAPPYEIATSGEEQSTDDQNGEQWEVEQLPEGVEEQYLIRSYNRECHGGYCTEEWNRGPAVTPIPAHQCRTESRGEPDSQDDDERGRRSRNGSGHEVQKHGDTETRGDESEEPTIHGHGGGDTYTAVVVSTILIVGSSLPIVYFWAETRPTPPIPSE